MSMIPIDNVIGLRKLLKRLESSSGEGELAYKTNDVDQDGDFLYVGKSDGTNWLVERIEETGGGDLEKRYADILNNSAYENYEDAWTNRLTLAYDRA